MDDLLRDESYSVLYVSEAINDSVRLKSLLRNAGHQAAVQHAADLESLQDHMAGGSYDIVVVEFELHEIDYDQVIHAVRATAMPCPVVALLQALSDETAQELFDLGVSDIVRSGLDFHLLHVIAREVTTRKLRERLQICTDMLSGSEKRCQLLIDGSSEAVAYIQDGVHVYANHAYLELLGYTQFDELDGMTLLDHTDPTSKDAMRAFLKAGEGEITLGLSRRDGSVFQALLSTMRATFDGEPCLQVFVTSKVEDSQLQEQIDYLSKRDILTGLYNKNYFIQRLREELEALAGSENSSLLLHLQVGGLDEVKKRAGTSVVDMLLTDYGKKLEEIFTTGEVVARYGAYSFLILAPGSGGGQSEGLCQRIIEFARGYVFTHEKISVTINVSIGVVVIDRYAPSAMEIIDRSERATLDAEAQGANACAVYKPSADSSSEKEIEEEWSRKIRSALKENRFMMVYQPMVSLAGDREWMRYEVFLRMTDEDGTRLNPGVFIAKAEKSELIVAIDRWLILSSMKKVLEHQKRNERLQLYIHLTVQSLQDPGFIPWLVQRLDVVKLHAPMIFIQIRASDAGFVIGPLMELIKQVSDRGCELVIDDFGEGREPFALLNHLPVKTLKVSRSFMDSFSSSKANQDSVRSIVDQAKQHDVQVVVPNVEDPASLQILWAMGASLVQGNFIQPASDEIGFDFSTF